MIIPESEHRFDLFIWHKWCNPNLNLVSFLPTWQNYDLEVSENVSARVHPGLSYQSFSYVIHINVDLCFINDKFRSFSYFELKADSIPLTKITPKPRSELVRKQAQKKI